MAPTGHQTRPKKLESNNITDAEECGAEARRQMFNKRVLQGDSSDRTQEATDQRITEDSRESVLALTLRSFGTTKLVESVIV